MLFLGGVNGPKGGSHYVCTDLNEGGFLPGEAVPVVDDLAPQTPQVVGV